MSFFSRVMDVFDDWGNNAIDIAFGRRYRIEEEPIRWFDSRADRDDTPRVKIETQKVTDFSGRNGDWTKWKHRTATTLGTCGHEDVIIDPEAARQNPRRNRLVYSLLANATIEGTAYHLVHDYKELQCGYSAWNALCCWYDGTEVQHESADELRSKIGALKLTSNDTASGYINKYKTWMAELDLIPGEAYSPSHKVQVFLDNIIDDDFETTVSYLRNTGSNLRECYLKIRMQERKLARTKSNKRKRTSLHGGTVKRTRFDDKDEESREPKYSESRRVGDAMEVTPLPSGKIALPKDQWYEDLSKAGRDFIQAYNAKVKHDEPTSSMTPPSDLIIKSKSRRYRSTARRSKNEQDEDDDVNSEGDDASIDVGDPDSKNIQFGLRKKNKKK